MTAEAIYYTKKRLNINDKEYEKYSKTELEIMEKFYLCVYDFLKEEKKDKISSNDFLIQNNQCYELELYLNAQWWRLESLIDGAVLSIENKKMLSAIISLRHAYETIVHTFNLLKQLEKSLESGNGKKFYNSLLTFLHMATEFYDNLFEKNNDSEK